MTYEQATENDVSMEQARREIIAHGMNADILDHHLFAWEGNGSFEQASDCIRFGRNDDGTVSGREVLEWLGY